MVRLLLIRHGVTEWNDSGRLMGRQPIPLAPHGRAQIEHLATAVAAVRLDAIFSSPQLRTQQTAAIVAAPHSLPVTTEEGLAEVWLTEEWQGRTFQELRTHADLLALRSDPTHVSAHIEPIAAVQKRVIETFERLVSVHEGQTIALVSHGDPLRVLLAHLLSMPLTEYRRLIVTPGSLSVVDRHRNRSQVMLLSWKPSSTLDLVPAGNF